jgi:hypothetical protein
MALQKLSVGAVIALAATGIFLTLVTSGLLLSTQQVPSNGTVLSTVEVGVYNDQPCTHNCTLLSWGTLAPGSSTTRTVYVKNTGTLPVTLSMNAGDWDPTQAGSDMTLSWNRQGAVLNASDSVSAELTLTVSPSINSSITDFNFNITIAGTET